MKLQRTDEWIKQNAEYHKKQYQNINRSTVFFCDFEERMNVTNDGHIVDIGAGLGANLKYMSERFPKLKFTGIDINKPIIELGNTYLKELDVKNIELIYGDLFNPDPNLIGKFDGLTILQTYSHFSEYKTPLEKMINLKPTWIGINSLFYDGPIHATIQIQDYSRPSKEKEFLEYYYNIYSIELVRKEFAKHGFTIFEYTPFEIDIDIEKPSAKIMGTHTIKTVLGKRLQISGPILMSWYFIFASKKKY